MDEHALTVLEFYQLLDRVAGYAQTVEGADAIRSLRPKSQMPAITAKHGLYADTLDMLSRRGLRPPPLHFESVTGILRRVTPEGAVVEAMDLLLCLKILDKAAAVREFMQRASCRAYACLQELGHALDPCALLVARLRRSLDQDGGVLDGASDTLRDLRRRVRTVENQIRKRLECLLRDPDCGGLLQEKFATIRNGRFVVPVRREFKAEMPGIIHDHSNSGQTLFIEPAETLEAGNELADLRLQEKDEVLRILAELSAVVRKHAPALSRNQWLITELDVAVAIAGWGNEYACSLPTFGCRLSLVRARHPLLQFRLKNTGEDVVPLDFELPQGARAMVITGSNTGGKTVALKAVGLLSLAAQAGLPVPVESGSTFIAFRQIFADIGDEQSLDADLSTFSAHIRHATGILRHVADAGPSLVLLDELGAGTDPLEGGALACGILLELVACPALVIATTHLGVVKNLAHERKDMVNAAVRFNSETLRPEYTLDIGRPGASHALDIARRLGVPSGVLETAVEVLSNDHLRLEGMLAQMEEDQRLLSQRESEAQDTLAELTKGRDELRLELRSLRRERKQLLHEAYQQAEGIVLNTRKQMERLVLDLKRTSAGAERSDAAAGEARKAIEVRTKTLGKVIDETAPKPESPVRPDALQVGQGVWVERLQANARIVELGKDGYEVTVELGDVRFTVSARELGKATVELQDPPARVKVSHPRPIGRVDAEINLLGKSVDEALPGLDGFLSRALLGSLPQVRIIHGFGTGNLRRGIHDWLSQRTYIKGFRLGKHGEDPGGAGVTIVTLGS